MELLLLKVALASYLLATGVFGLGVLTTKEMPRTIAPALLAIAFLAHAGSIVARSVVARHFAVTTEFEAVSFFACLMVGVYLLAQLRFRLAAVGAVVAPLAFVFTLGSFAFYTGVRDLPPNLRSAWVPVHVLLASLGNAVLALAFCISLVYLLHERQLKEKRVGPLLRRLPPLERLDRLNYRALIWGFVLLTLGIVTGAIWSRYSWGRFWSWEEREIFSLITWILYAGLLQARAVAGWRGRRAATMTIVGFTVLLVSFVFGHMLFPGKHGGTFD